MFGRWQYSLTAIIVAIVFYSLNVVTSYWKVFTQFTEDKSFLGVVKLFFYLFLGKGPMFHLDKFLSLILISVLFGILFALVSYKVKMNMGVQKRMGVVGGISVFIAALIPGCAACGVGLISTLGIGAGFLSLLPFGGMSLGIIGIGILVYSIIKMTKDMYTCKLKNPQKKN